MGRDILVLMICVLFCGGFAWYSYDGYQRASQEPLLPQADEKSSLLVEDALASVTVESLNKSVDKTVFTEALKRNVYFPKAAAVVAPPPVPIVIAVPKVEPVKAEPEVKKEEDIFLYRGKVVVENELKYVIERVRDTKTYFVTRGESTREFSVIETTDKEVIIADGNDVIKVLKLIK